MSYFYGGIPEEFLKARKKIIPNELWSDFENFLQADLKKCIRVNKKKEINFREVAKENNWKIKKVPWLENGYWILEYEENPAKSIDHFAGNFYFQDASSQVPVEFLEISQGDVILDMCASPGSKATQISQKLAKGLLIANESDKKRLPQLFFNIEKCFSPNAAVWNFDGRKIGDIFPENFDKILLDAPCSGEGAKKDREFFRRWKKREIMKFSFLQKELLSSAFFALREGGILLYSTCTFSPEENEENIDFLLNRFKGKIELEKLESKFFHPGTQGENKDKLLRIFPEKNLRGGFFVAKFRKTSSVNLDGKKVYFKSRFEMLRKKRWLDFNSFLKKTFDLGESIRRENLFLTKEDEIFYFEGKIDKKIAPALSLGIKIAKVIKDGKFKLSTAFIQNFGFKFEKNVVGIEKEDAFKFIRGENLEVGDLELGTYAVKYKNIFLGTGLVQKKGKLKNQVSRKNVII